jgi:DNA-binding NarL/FixJ family response regulator
VAVWSADPLTVEGVTTILRSTPELRVLPVEELDVADVLIVAIMAPDTDIVEFMVPVSARPSTQIILLADELTEPQVRVLAEHSVTAVRSRTATTDADLVDLVRTVLSGAAMPPLAEQLTRADTGVLHPMGAPRSPLSSRERDMLSLLAEGYDTAEIAREMMYSERAVKYIVRGILRRLGSRNRAHAVAMATRLGLIGQKESGQTVGSR